jgi:hypothetical protein
MMRKNSHSTAAIPATKNTVAIILSLYVIRYAFFLGGFIGSRYSSYSKKSHQVVDKS